MAIWTLNGQNLPVSVSGSNLTQQVNMVGAQPADYNPDAVLGIRFSRTIVSGVLVDDSWTDQGSIGLTNGNGQTVITTLGSQTPGLGGNVTRVLEPPMTGGISTPLTATGNYCVPAPRVEWATYQANMKNDNGTLSITALTVEIEYTPGASPVASFNAVPTTLYEGQSVQFTDTSSQNPNQWSWNFDGGASGSTAQNPLVMFNTPGVYNVVLTATNNFGSNASAPTTITVLKREAEIWNGSAWVGGESWNGSAWVVPEVWDGVRWVPMKAPV